MKKEYAKSLKLEAYAVGLRFSRTDRKGNFNNESFEVHKVHPLSDDSAVVLYKKNTGKLAMTFWYYVDSGINGGWRYFFPKDSHLLGMVNLGYFKAIVEEHNLEYNE